MRRWLRVFAVGALTVLVAIDSASACRLFRSRCRPRCRVVSCRVVRMVEPGCGHVTSCQPCPTIVSMESLPVQCCVPADGSAHAVIVETEQSMIAAPSETRSLLAPESSPGVVVDTPRPATPAPVSEPLEPLSPIAPASAEKPLPAPAPSAGVAPQPQVKSAAEILAESEERELLEDAAAEAAKPAPPAAEPPMTKAPAEPTPPPAPVDEPATPIEPAPEEPAPAPVPEEPETPAEPTPKQPAPKRAPENFFDEEGDEPTDMPANEDRAPKPKKPSKEPTEDVFDEPEADAPSADEPADEAPNNDESEKTEDDPFAIFDAHPEPVRRWIDSSGRHETIGRIVEVHPDRVRILKRNGRYTTVPMSQLSRHDQAYATAVAERLAGRSPSNPAVTDTARR